MSGTASKILSNIRPQDFVTRIGGQGGCLQGGFQIPNLRRASFGKFFWQQQFVNRQHVFSVHHVGFIAVCAFFWWTGWFDTAPIERRDKHYMNGDKFKLQCALMNEGTRPAYKIAQEQGKIRYFYRGLDAPYTISEARDLMWKMRDNWLIQQYPSMYPKLKVDGDDISAALNAH